MCQSRHHKVINNNIYDAEVCRLTAFQKEFYKHIFRTFFSTYVSEFLDMF